MFAKVIIDLKTQEIESTYDYIVPSSMVGILKVGMRVYVPFGYQKRLGLVIELTKTSIDANKEILTVLDMAPIVNDSQLKLIDYIESRSFVSKAMAFSLIVPLGLHLDYRKQLLLTDKSNAFWTELIANKRVYLDELSPSLLKKVKSQVEDGMLLLVDTYKDRKSIQYEKQYSVKNHPKVLTERRQQIIQLIKSGIDKESSLLEEGISKSIINTLLEQGVLSYHLVEKKRKSRLLYQKKTESIILTQEQTNAIFEISQNLNKYKRFLLHGVVSSGKTEVFVEVKKILGKKPILIIVPEVTQVFQMAAYFELSFEDVYIIHSKLSSQERYDTWRAIKENNANVIIGTKQALFLPFKELGAIIIDECHDSNYIEANQPRYDSIEIAQVLSRQMNLPLILSTATPTIVQYYDSQMGKMTYLGLEKSIRNTLRTIRIVDMKQELLNGNLSMFSNDLKKGINGLKPKEQAMILVNRRGYANFMMCRECGFVPICDTCLTNLVYHKQKNKLICHHCGKNYPVRNTCPSCNSNKIKPVGTGIEQVEQSFKETFNQKKVIRLDSDVANKTKAEEMLFLFKEKEYDVLIGTQLIAKGHDFDVSLSAVMLAELGLKLPSYLANEHTYNLLKQMIGRSGRYQDGLSLIQTYSPNHFVFESLSEPYEVFYTQELENRRLGHFPPFTNMVQIRFGHKNEDELDETLNRIKRDIIKTHSQYTVLGPSDSFIHYANGLFYSNLTIKAPKRLDLTPVLRNLKLKYKHLFIDINPYEDFL